ncbi:capsular biosynthesis protein CpsH [Pontibacillus sp. HMF3514]|uniref:capsular biosynthesis protein CpsH n=1 Tax=Pontibacillus sp. HMF3514 TaxID=2692425 RepID=UPI00131F6603|nr:capsular biosynthesis protein CpsH [Pontibacillus sp. HMF3514]QHE53730.1 capsular biosynthesis protein CpsH [Pontibacillus sp. HMF3514]
MKLKNKLILFIAPAFFGYEKKISEKMVQMGAEVDFFDERSITSSIEKALLKISPHIFQKKTICYYEDIFEKISSNNYDYILIIKCEMMPIETIKKLKELYPQAILCLYLYDSLKNIKGISKKLKFFDRIVSFDLEDVKENDNFIFRPLFFTDDFRKEPCQKDEYKYDLSFIGTIHTDRYKIVKKINSIAHAKKLKFYLYAYLQSKFIYYFYKMTKKEFADVSIKEFQFGKIESSEIAEIIDDTKVVLDIQHPNQTGLTMRTIEMIGMNKKLITTNQSIKEYDFYNPKNIEIINRHPSDIPKDFFNDPYEKLEDDIYIKYSIEYWIKEVLGLED